jgi:hypothetical protein
VPLTAQQSQRISQAIAQKISGPCPLCGVRAWHWGQDLVVLRTERFEVAPPTAEEVNAGLNVLLNRQRQIKNIGDLLAQGAEPPIPTPPPPASPPAYPTLPLMCDNCGNTMLLNVFPLGIADLWPEIKTRRVG